jgi:cohesin loading factor subunit SCC2
MAENFAAFGYKIPEEVLTVIKYLTSVLSTTGMQPLEIISPSRLLTTHLHEPSQTSQGSHLLSVTNLPSNVTTRLSLGTVSLLPPIYCMQHNAEGQGTRLLLFLIMIP